MGDSIDKDSPTYMFAQIQTQYGFIVEQLSEIKREQAEIKQQLADGNIEFSKIQQTLKTHEIEIEAIKACLEKKNNGQDGVEFAIGGLLIELCRNHYGKMITGACSFAAVVWAYLHKN